MRDDALFRIPAGPKPDRLGASAEEVARRQNDAGLPEKGLCPANAASPPGGFVDVVADFFFSVQCGYSHSRLDGFTALAAFVWGLGFVSEKSGFSLARTKTALLRRPLLFQRTVQPP